MLGNQKWKLLSEISKPYALDILEQLLKKPMRFSELKKICLSQKTLTNRLHELEDSKIIETLIEKPKGQKVKVFYYLTNKGKQIMELASPFTKI